MDLINKKCKIILSVSNLNENETQELNELLKKIKNINKISFKIFEDISLEKFVSEEKKGKLLSKDEVFRILDTLK